MNSILRSKLFIKKIIALFLLGVFLLAITPKKTLHTLLANHTDNTSKSGDGKNQQLNIGGFNCKCDDLVAESNFIAGTSFIIIAYPEFHSEITSYYHSYASLPQLLFNLRGPPLKV